MDMFYSAQSIKGKTDSKIVVALMTGFFILSFLTSGCKTSGGKSILSAIFSNSSSAAAARPVTLSPVNQTFVTGESVPFIAIGGTPPFSFYSVLGYINSLTGSYTVPLNATSSIDTIRVNDSAGSQASTTINIKAFQTKDNFAPVNPQAISGGKSIAVDSNGNIFVAGFDTSNNGYWIVRKSTDGGATWATVDSYQQSGGSSSQAFSIAIDSTDNIYVGGLACSTPSSGSCTSLIGLVRSSSNHGRTWNTVDSFPITTTNPGGQYGVLSIGIDSSNTVYTAGSDGTWLVRKSTDHGTTWHTVESGTRGYASYFLVGPWDILYAVGSVTTTGSDWQWRIRRNLNNMGWTTVDTYAGSGTGLYAHPTAITSDRSGVLFVAGYQGIAGNSSDPGYWIVRKGSPD